MPLASLREVLGDEVVLTGLVNAQSTALEDPLLGCVLTVPKRLFRFMEGARGTNSLEFMR